MLWDMLLSAAALYIAVYVPLALAMPAARWSDEDYVDKNGGGVAPDVRLGYILDSVFVLDVLLRFRMNA